MSKGHSRAAIPVRRVREAGIGGGGRVEEILCKARRVQVDSERTPVELRAMDPAYLAVDDERVVIRRGGGVIAVVITEVGPLLTCMTEYGVRYEADLSRTTNEMVVPVRPLERR